MKRVARNAPAAELRPWRVSIIRHRREILGRVSAADHEAAEAAAVDEFKLNDYQRRRLVIEPVA